MENKLQNLSVMDISKICGVARSTVSYWIENKALPAHRISNKYMISADDLILFLKSERRNIPQILFEYAGGLYPQMYRPFKRCWEYWADNIQKKQCHSCNVFKLNTYDCFTVKGTYRLKSPVNCYKCEYYREYFAPRVAFIYQIEKPAAIYKDLYLWSGNKALAEICGLDLEKLVGIGIEDIIHPDFLRQFINYNKRKIHGDTSIPYRLRVLIRNKWEGKIDVYLAIYDLKIPVGAFLAIVEKVNNIKQPDR
jgi:PAS domain-containing protein